MSKVKIALIGAGNIANAHLESYCKVPDAEIVAICDINPDRLAGAKHQCFTERKLQIIERDQGKCVLCNLCVRTCEENAKKGILGLVGRGFDTVVKPEFQDPAVIAGCKDCLMCANVCPTGALKILK